MGLSSKIAVSLNGKLTATPDLSTGEVNVAIDVARSFADGVLAGQANRLWADRGQLAASANSDLDLAGALADAFGVAQVFAKVRGLVVVADKLNTNNVVLGAAAANPWVGLLGATHTVTLRPGAALAVVCGDADLPGYLVTAGTGDLLRVANSGAGSVVNYDIAILGCAT